MIRDRVFGVERSTTEAIIIPGHISPDICWNRKPKKAHGTGSNKVENAKGSDIISAIAKTRKRPASVLATSANAPPTNDPIHPPTKGIHENSKSISNSLHFRTPFTPKYPPFLVWM
mmetsp:Transcript_17590/g.28645  ORF Transcript_17590/g.28645 Transcript_17590/m.28645 type:complete len:116 (+) Transcript_17590:299-646(+)